MIIDMGKARKKLAILWISVTSLIFICLIFISSGNRFIEDREELWSWFLQNTVPVLTMIIGVLVVEANSVNENKVVETFYYKICFYISMFYLLMIILTIFLVPLADVKGGFTPIGFINFSEVYLLPFQGFVTTSLGIFFVKSKVGDV